MVKCFVDSEECKKTNIDDLLKTLQTTKEGLSNSEAKSRLESCGHNSLEEKKEIFLLKLLRYFWGPIPWMIEAAAILSIIIGHYADFYIIFILLITNGAVDFWEEFQAGNAIKALKKKLALKCIVKKRR